MTQKSEKTALFRFRLFYGITQNSAYARLFSLQRPFVVYLTHRFAHISAFRNIHSAQSCVRKFISHFFILTVKKSNAPITILVLRAYIVGATAYHKATLVLVCLKYYMLLSNITQIQSTYCLKLFIDMAYCHYLICGRRRPHRCSWTLSQARGRLGIHFEISYCVPYIVLEWIYR